MTVTVVDDYPSRRAGQSWRVQERKEPVVYGKPESGPLTETQLQEFERNGFIQLEGYLDPSELEALIQEGERLRSEVRLPDERVIVEPEGRLVRSVFEIHKLSPLCRRLCGDPRIAGIARQIVGDEVYIHQSRINYKPGFEGKEFYWHSDFETWHVEDGMPRMRAVSCVVNLTENFEHNGPLMIIPGSHKHFIVCEGETPENHFKQSLRKQSYGVPCKEALTQLVEDGGIRACKGKPGTVVFFDCNAMHGSFGNMTPYPRNNLFFVFNSMENRLQAPFCDRNPRPEFIASRDFQPVASP